MSSIRFILAVLCIFLSYSSIYGASYYVLHNGDQTESNNRLRTALEAAAPSTTSDEIWFTCGPSALPEACFFETDNISDLTFVNPGLRFLGLKRSPDGIRPQLRLVNSDFNFNSLTGALRFQNITVVSDGVSAININSPFNADIEISNSEFTGFDGSALSISSAAATSLTVFNSYFHDNTGTGYGVDISMIGPTRSSTFSCVSSSFENTGDGNSVNLNGLFSASLIGCSWSNTGADTANGPTIGSAVFAQDMNSFYSHSLFVENQSSNSALTGSGAIGLDTIDVAQVFSSAGGLLSGNVDGVLLTATNVLDLTVSGVERVSGIEDMAVYLSSETNATITRMLGDVVCDGSFTGGDLTGGDCTSLTITGCTTDSVLWVPSAIVDFDNDTYFCDIDCNDSSASISPNETEVCNNFDDDCNGLIDDGVAPYNPDGDTFFCEADLCPFDGPAFPPIMFVDIDNDGIPEECDPCDDTQDPLMKGRENQCGCDVLDVDTDGDLLLDCFDICPNDASNNDTDGDGTPDCVDVCPICTYAGADECPGDPLKIVPGQCGCNVADVESDFDGVADCLDECPLNDSGAEFDFKKIRSGQCGCGQSDNDTDGDDVADCVDLCPDVFTNTKFHPGQCGCDQEDTDTDGDGIADCVDNCPNDPDKIEPGICGCGTSDASEREDNIPACLDVDEDIRDVPTLSACTERTTIIGAIGFGSGLLTGSGVFILFSRRPKKPSRQLR